MQLAITFKQMESSDALKSYAQEKLDKLDKMLDAPGEANLVLSIEKIRHIAEVNLVSDKLRINAKEEAETMYSALDGLADKVQVQIKKYKEKARRHLAGDKQTIKTTPELESLEK
ncbi:MAG: ribosome-associated translation inhibitor RaiA [Desulfotignum sp.]|nr:ribosome-associated translation inhibitor RaiA [Desulfotignum sp.]MCF8088055.1 ribosome-associated translation inhibitor RaiA [Desulfotignum sp.]MCF8137649.1 ribosome-associated translation inhibitor RaiA [Desulfotignum sp.]